MSFGEVLVAGVYLARRHLWPLAAVTAWGALPSYAAIDIATTMVQPARPSLLVLSGILALLGLIGLALLSAAVTIGCARLLVPGDPAGRLDAADLYAHAALRLWPLALLLLILVLLAGPLVILLPVGIYVGVRWAMSFTAVVLDGDSAMESLRRSWTITRRAWWYTAIVVLVGTLVTAILGFALSWVAGGFVAVLGDETAASPLVGALSTLGKSLALIATEPFSAAIMVVLYYELRARSDGRSGPPDANGAPAADPGRGATREAGLGQSPNSDEQAMPPLLPWSSRQAT